MIRQRRARETARFYAEAGVDARSARRRSTAVAGAASAPAPEPRAELPRRRSRLCAPRPARAGAPATPDVAVMAAREAARSAASLDELRDILAKFEGCALRTTAKQLVFADGNPQARVMFVGEAPGREEDLEGLPFVGRSGKLLDLMLAAIGLDRTSAYIANIIPWRPPGNRTPTPQESQICLPFIQRQIELANPDILVCLGGPSSQTLLGVKEGIKRTRGQMVRVPHRHARDPRHRDLPSGLSAALAAGEALRLARFPRDQEGARRGRKGLRSGTIRVLISIEVSCRRGALRWTSILSFSPASSSRSRSRSTSSSRAFTIGLAAYIATLLGDVAAHRRATAISCSRGSGPRSSRSRSPWASCRASCCPTSSAPTGAASRSSPATSIGPLIGYEVLTAFFLEATFLGVLLFGWNRVPPWLSVAVGRDRRGRHRDLGVLDPLRQ